MANFGFYQQLTAAGNATDNTNQYSQYGSPSYLVSQMGGGGIAQPFSQSMSYQLQMQEHANTTAYLQGQQYSEYQQRSQNFRMLGLAAMPLLGAIGGAFAGGAGTLAGYAVGTGLYMAGPQMAQEFGLLDLPTGITIEEQTRAIMSQAYYGTAWNTLDPFVTRGLRGTSISQAQAQAGALYGTMQGMGYQGAELSRIMPALEAIGAYADVTSVEQLTRRTEEYLSAIRDFVSRTSASFEETTAMLGTGAPFGLQAGGVEKFLGDVSMGSQMANMSPQGFVNNAAMFSQPLLGFGTDLTSIFPQYGLSQAFAREAQVTSPSPASAWNAPFDYTNISNLSYQLGMNRFMGTGAGRTAAAALSTAPGQWGAYLETGYVPSAAYGSYWGLSPEGRYAAQYNVGEFLANRGSELFHGDIARIMGYAPDLGGNLEAMGAYLSEQLNAQYGVGMVPSQGRGLVEMWQAQQSIGGRAAVWEYMNFIGPNIEAHEQGLTDTHMATSNAIIRSVYERTRTSRGEGEGTPAWSERTPGQMLEYINSDLTGFTSTQIINEFKRLNPSNATVKLGMLMADIEPGTAAWRVMTDALAITRNNRGIYKDDDVLSLSSSITIGAIMANPRDYSINVSLLNEALSTIAESQYDPSVQGFSALFTPIGGDYLYDNINTTGLSNANSALLRENFGKLNLIEATPVSRPDVSGIDLTKYTDSDYWDAGEAIAQEKYGESLSELDSGEINNVAGILAEIGLSSGNVTHEEILHSLQETMYEEAGAIGNRYLNLSREDRADLARAAENQEWGTLSGRAKTLYEEYGAAGINEVLAIAPEAALALAIENAAGDEMDLEIWQRSGRSVAEFTREYSGLPSAEGTTTQFYDYSSTIKTDNELLAEILIVNTETLRLAQAAGPAQNLIVGTEQ